MKNKIIFLLLVALLLSACSGGAKSTPLPTVVLDSQSQTASTPGAVSQGIVAASGIIVPEQEAQMAFTQSGSLMKVNVAEGEQVEPNKILAELDNTSLQINLSQAKRSLQELLSTASIAAAEQDLATARQSLKDQQDKVDAQFYRRASDTLIENTQGEIDLAKQALSRASDSYRLVARLEDGDNRKAAALVNMTNAQLRLNELLAKYNWYSGKPSEIDTALAKAKLDVAKAAVQEAEWYLSVLKGEQIPAEATGSNLAKLETAKTNIANIQDLLDHSRLISPISGIVVQVNALVGEMVSPGEVIITITNVQSLHVETTDLSERDVPQVKVGQEVQISIKALGSVVTGHVTDISPVSTTIGGDVVYKTKIDFDSIPEGLRSGMSVDVHYITN